MALQQTIDAGLLHVKRDDQLAIQEHAREITDSAADFNDAPPDLGAHQPALPCKIVSRLSHAPLIF